MDFVGGACYFTGSSWLLWDNMKLLSGMPFTPEGPNAAPVEPSAPVLLDNGNITMSNCTFDQLTPAVLHDSASAWNAVFSQSDNISCRFFLFGDISYTIDSVLYIIL
jgi:hypothetical protein